MGMTTYYSGQINFSRSLSYAEIKGSPFFRRESDESYGHEIEFVTSSSIVEDDNGFSTTIVATGIQVHDGEEGYSHYDVDRELLELLAQLPADVGFSGFLEGYTGEDGGYRWRYYAKRHSTGRTSVVEIQPRLIWPLRERGLADNDEQAVYGFDRGQQ